MGPALRPGGPRGEVRRRPTGEPPPLPRELTPPRRYLLALLVVWSVVWVVVLLAPSTEATVTRFELALMDPLVAHRTAWTADVARAVQRVGLHWVIPIVTWTGLVVMLATRRIRHIAILMGALLFASALVLAIRIALHRPRPMGFEILGEWRGFSHPSGPTARLAVVLVVVVLGTVPAGRWRRVALWMVGGAVLVFALAQVHLAVEHPSDPLVGATVGVALAAVLVGSFAPEAVFPITYRRGRAAHLDVTGARGEAIRRAVHDQLGLTVEGVEPVGLEGSAGSTPLRLSVVRSGDGAPDVVFAKLAAQSHLRADRWYKLGRTLAYGRLEDERPYRSVRHLVEHEDYVLRLFVDHDVPTARPIGLAELTPEREYLIVTEFLDGALEIGDRSVDVDEPMIDAALSIVRRLWSAGIAHRDIKPANVMVRGDQVFLIDAAFAEVRPSPWRQAIDLANMMLVLALRSSAELVYGRARRQFDADEIGEAFACSRGVTVPSQVRTEIRNSGHDLLRDFRSLAPSHTRIRIQRITWRRVALTAGVVLAALFLATAFLANLSALGLA